MVVDSLSNSVSKYPKTTIVIILAVSLVAAGCIAVFGIDQEFSESSFLPDNEVIKASDDVDELFKTSNTYSVSILVKGKDGDVLTSDVLAEMIVVERDIVTHPKIQPTLMDPDNPSSNANSVADVIAQSTLAAQGVMAPTYAQKIAAVQGMTNEQVKQTVSGLLASNNTPVQVKGMFSMMLTKDFDPTSGVYSAKGTMIFLTLNGSLEVEEGGHGMSSVETIYSRTEENMAKVVEAAGLEHTEMRVMGSSMIMNEIMDSMNENVNFLFPLAFLMVIVVLALVFRKLLDMVFSLIALSLGILWMYGFGSAMGYSFNPMTMIVPILLIGLGIDYGIHLTMRHREEIARGSDVNAAVAHTVTHVGMALFLVTVTTVAAFLSNLVSPMGPLQEFGIIAAIGITSCFFTMVTFVPACLHIRDSRLARKMAENPEKYGKHKNGSKLFDKGVALKGRGISAGAVAAEHHPWIIIMIVIVISAGSIAMAVNLETTFDFEDFLPEDLEITQDLNYLMNEFAVAGGEAPEVQVLVEGDITDPSTINALHDTIESMSDDTHVLQAGGEPDVESIFSLMEDWATDSNLHGFDDPNYNSTFEALYNSTFTATGMVQSGADVTPLFDWLYLNPLSAMDAMSVLHRTGDGVYDATVLRISIGIDDVDEEKVKELMSEMDDNMEPLEPVSERAVLTGGSVITTIILDILNESQIDSLILTLIVCLLILVLVFYLKDRSFALGAITLLPVIFCVLWILGTMYVMDISLNIMTLMVTSLTIGIGVDYGIHISHRFAEDLERFDDIYDASCNTVQNTGAALFGGASTTIVGFGLISFATMPPIAQFGLITALTILYSSIASVFVLPTFLVIWAKWKRKRNGVEGKEEKEETGEQKETKEMETKQKTNKVDEEKEE